MTVKLEDIYADPHVLDAALASGEAFELEKAGTGLAKVVPLPTAPVQDAAAPLGDSLLETFERVYARQQEALRKGEQLKTGWTPEQAEAHRRWFLEQYGPDAYEGGESIDEIMARVREPRRYL